MERGFDPEGCDCLEGSARVPVCCPPRPSTAAAWCAPKSTAVKGDTNPPGTYDSAANAYT